MKCEWCGDEVSVSEFDIINVWRVCMPCSDEFDIRARQAGSGITIGEVKGWCIEARKEAKEREKARAERWAERRAKREAALKEASTT